MGGEEVRCMLPMKRRRVRWSRRELDFIEEWVKANRPADGGRWQWKTCMKEGRHIFHSSHAEGCKIKDAARRWCHDV